MYLLLRFILFITILTFTACGSSGGNNTNGDDDDDNDDNDTSINTEKLVGTPFEGMTIGDDFGEDHFNCGQYRTEQIDSFPIYIFAAFFTESEEEVIQEGIDIANNGIGFTAYELTDEWSDDLRVVYKVDELEGASGRVDPIMMNFDNVSSAAGIQASDWQMLIEDVGANNNFLYAHELGHATGIRRHNLIDYENDAWLELEENSLMRSNGERDDNPALTDYNFMMEMQGEIMQDHLGETGFQVGTDECDE